MEYIYVLAFSDVAKGWTGMDIPDSKVNFQIYQNALQNKRGGDFH